jgi:hypothetical protein
MRPVLILRLLLFPSAVRGRAYSDEEDALAAGFAADSVGVGLEAGSAEAGRAPGSAAPGFFSLAGAAASEDFSSDDPLVPLDA